MKGKYVFSILMNGIKEIIVIFKINYLKNLYLSKSKIGD
jgi:hypothetical protein